MATADFKALLAGGENSTVEFKRDDLANHELVADSDENQIGASPDTEFRHELGA